SPAHSIRIRGHVGSSALLPRRGCRSPRLLRVRILTFSAPRVHNIDANQSKGALQRGTSNRSPRCAVDTPPQLEYPPVSRRFWLWHAQRISPQLSFSPAAPLQPRMQDPVGTEEQVVTAPEGMDREATPAVTAQADIVPARMVLHMDPPLVTYPPA